MRHPQPCHIHWPQLPPSCGKAGWFGIWWFDLILVVLGLLLLAGTIAVSRR